MLVVEFNDKENNLFQQTLEWLSTKLNTSPTLMNIQTEELYINPFTRTVVDKQGSRIYLTAKEFDLLYFMYSHKGQVFTKEQLYQNVWGDDDIPNANNMTSFIRKLRKKIEPNPDNPQYILTVWGVGYKFSEEKP
ncbi:transcriptional regulator [Enterococcus faecium]|uniref:Winged helix family transcriptional regulator n=4 Tax=Bacillota TaxID=1239 RepID=A0A414M549_9FIRM|nr:transcriptional regulator [Enterococcus faecium]RGI00881.1 winged helix family transcriptional regulator [Coprobacillus sp. AM26-5AC]RGJ24207.1 winged helix family transcriptional regulator [Coprococcus comes]RGZ31123.1 winged helix family transcriptional regulator [Mediterraneibacter gnavus]RHF04598.1 winged helix family transcriptional regulator [Agathobacter rectalis]RHR22477.1 winged helix family transcriptional regulator [Blautia sp. AF19-13LB]RHS45000.1 winged helix family transcript